MSDLSFELHRGEAIGIVGRNGAGKSTLLQLISETVEPTSGSIISEGKIAALLELGSGFSPEFSGRENILMNGILNGLTRKEIENKMNKIIAFADIGVHIDEPLRTYSSGMVVRLAFAVIANVDADILIIDEALAVGDAFFTQKCMRFINDFRKRGALLFVSHDAQAIMSICDRALLIENGKQIILGKPKEVIELYTKHLHKELGSQVSEAEGNISQKLKENIKENMALEMYKERWMDYRVEARRVFGEKHKVENTLIITSGQGNEESYGGEKAEIKEAQVYMIDPEKRRIESITGGEIIALRINCEAKEDIRNLILGFILKNSSGLTLLGDNTYNAALTRDIEVKKGDHIDVDFIFTIPLLPKGDYSITASVAEGNIEEHTILHWVNDIIILRSECSNIAAGLAGIPVHSINIKKYTQEKS